MIQSHFSLSIVLMSSANNNNISVAEDPPDSPTPPSDDGFVEVTGVLFNTAFSGTFDFASESSLSQIAHDLHGRISQNTQQLFGLASPLGLRGMDIFKCMSHIVVHPARPIHTFFQRQAYLYLVISRSQSSSCRPTMTRMPST
jgi:hypothetical protein